MAFVIGANYFLTVVNNTMGSPLSLTIARSFLAAVIVGLLLILIGLLRDEEGAWRPWRTWLRYTAIGLGCFIILVALLGYIGLATFVSIQVVVTGTVLLTAYIGFLSARAIGAEGGFAETSVGRWLAAKSSTDEATLDQLGLVVSLAINLMIVLDLPAAHPPDVGFSARRHPGVGLQGWHGFQHRLLPLLAGSASSPASSSSRSAIS